MTYEQQEEYLSTAPAPQPQRKMRVRIGGYVEMENSEGKISREFVMEVLDLLIPDGGFFGWGEGAAICAQVEALRPGFEILEHWPARS